MRRMRYGFVPFCVAMSVFASAAYYNRKIAASEDAGLGRFLLLGLMLGVAVLARIDIAFLVAALIGWHLLRAHLLHRSRPMPERMRRLGRVLKQQIHH